MSDEETRKFNDVQKLDWGRFLADTMHLSRDQIGGYVLLLAHYWITAKPIPDDDHRLRMITRTREADWARTKPVLAEFFEVRNGFWTHKRVESDLRAAKEDFERRRAQTAAARAARHPTEHVTADVTKPLAPVDKMIRHKEYEAVCEKMESISRQYASHQTWTDADRGEWGKLKARRAELKAMLDIKV